MSFELFQSHPITSVHLMTIPVHGYECCFGKSDRSIHIYIPYVDDAIIKYLSLKYDHQPSMSYLQDDFYKDEVQKLVAVFMSGHWYYAIPS